MAREAAEGRAPADRLGLEVCNTGGDALHVLVRAELPAFASALDDAGRYLPRHVWSELERFATCGDPREGFAWLECTGCAHHRLVPFTCKGRGFCPSCGGRRMNERAVRWVDEVFPHVAVRQWVLTVPWGRRWLLAREPALARGVLALALREVKRWQRERTGRRGGQTGSVTVAQRFGSSLNLNLHFHCLVLDGVYHEDPHTGALSWHRCGSPSTSDVEELVERIAWGCERWLGRRGYGGEEEELDDEDDALGVIQAAAVAGRSALSRARRSRREQVLGGRTYRLPPRCASYEGYTLHAGVVVGAADRAGLERLCRYVARPPLSASRLEVGEDGRVRVHFKRPWADGTAYVTMTRLAFVERLASLVPPPRANTVLYHGVLASRSKLRERVRPPPPPPRADAPPDRKLTRKPSSTSRWVPWARLLWRVFEVHAFGCPTCGQAMRLRAVVMPPATLRVLSSLGWSARGPPAAGTAAGA